MRTRTIGVVIVTFVAVRLALNVVLVLGAHTLIVRKKIKEPEIPLVAIEDLGDIVEPCPKDLVMVYHTHGLRNYMGTAKLHCTPECQHLRHWKPERRCKGLRLSKTILREQLSTSLVDARNKCGSCWPKKRE